jgi:hypothetical protein
VVMPKVLPVSLYVHNARPATSRQIQSSTRTGRTVLSYISADVFVQPPAQVEYAGNDYYPMDFDDTAPDKMSTDHINGDQANESNIIPGTGVTIVPPAKRYHNSVRVCICVFITSSYPDLMNVACRMSLLKHGWSTARSI